MTLRALLGAAIPVPDLPAGELALLERLQLVLDDEIAPLAAKHDAVGRYPTGAVDALRRSGVTTTAVPVELGGPGCSHRFSLEAQVRMAAADSAVAQIFKVHDELVREILVYCPEALRPRLAAEVLDGAVLGLAVAEAGRRVDDPWTTIATARPDGGFSISGTKIYATGSAEPDYLAVWAFDPVAGADDPMRGLVLNLVVPNAPGVRIVRDWDAFGQRATDSGTVIFDDVQTDPGLHASLPGRAPLPQNAIRYQAGFAACLVGLGIGAVAAAVPFIADRARPWPSSGVTSAAADPMVRRLAGELVADLAAAHALTLRTADLLDAFELGEIDRTQLAVPIYAAKAAASRAGLRATQEIFTLMGTSATKRELGFDRWWRNARTLSLHDPVDWKQEELGHHVLTGWDPPPGIYQ